MNSVRKHIRNEKARIRAGFSDSAEAEGKIKELVEKLFQPYSERVAVGADETKLT